MGSGLIAKRTGYSGPCECRWKYKEQVVVLTCGRPGIPFQPGADTKTGRNEHAVELVAHGEFVDAVPVRVNEVPAPVPLSLVTRGVDPQHAMRARIGGNAFGSARTSGAISPARVRPSNRVVDDRNALGQRVVLRLAKVHWRRYADEI